MQRHGEETPKGENTPPVLPNRLPWSMALEAFPWGHTCFLLSPVSGHSENVDYVYIGAGDHQFAPGYMA
jgi:hypothetical protein